MPRGWFRTGQQDRDDESSGGGKPHHRSKKERIVAHHRQQEPGRHRADDVLEVIDQPRQRQRTRVARLVRQHVRDGRLEGRREGGGRRLQQEDQDIDLPDLGDERQAERLARPHQIQRDQKRPAVHPVRERASDGGNADIRHHLDGEDRPVLDREVGAGELERVATVRLAGVSHASDIGGLPAAAGRLREVGAVVREDGMDPIRDRHGKAARDKSAATRRVTLSCNSAKANLLVRSMATSK
jgi:hypothetical protein